MNPYRAGFADALFGRPCSSPWKDAGWRQIVKTVQYTQGYLAGQQTGVRYDV